jgi:hypothetical protein
MERARTKVARVVWFLLGWFVGPLLIQGCQVVDQRTRQELEKAYGPNPPKVEACFASREVAPRDTWKIYLKGSDPDGDMTFIQVSMWVPGGFLNPVRLAVGPSSGSRVSGYLALHTGDLPFSAMRFGGSELTVYISLEDRAGHVSERASLSGTVILGARREEPPAGRFEEVHLGTIPVQFMQAPSLGGMGPWP